MEPNKRLMFGLAGVAAVAIGGALVVALSLGVLPRPSTHVVQRGDTLHAIAVANGVSVSELKAWNDIDNEDKIEVGQVIVMWPRAHVAAPTAASADKAPAGHTLKVTGAVANTTGRLAMPPEKKCLSGPSGTNMAEEEIVVSQGLSYDQIRGSMNGFVQNTLSCISGADTFPSGALEMEFTVACTGRVANIDIVDQSDWSNDMAQCVVETLKYAPFPAHDLPDGEVFGYPLRFSK